MVNPVYPAPAATSAPAASPPFAASISAVSWPAIIAGAVVAMAATVLLTALGSGIGLAAVSPWPNSGASGMTVVVAAAVWFIVTQWVSAALGGYMAGRLRTRWHGTHAHEVFFRDTAHGLVAWALASVVMTATVSSTVASSIGALGHAAGAAAEQGIKGAASGLENASGAYDLDRLLRPGTAATAAPAGADPKAEIGHILKNSAVTGSLSDGDRNYLVQLVATRSGVSTEEAQKRVDDFVASIQDAEAKAKAATDSARRDAAQTSLYLAMSLLVGAFVASVSAALGGRLRDEHP